MTNDTPPPTISHAVGASAKSFARTASAVTEWGSTSWRRCLDCDHLAVPVISGTVSKCMACHPVDSGDTEGGTSSTLQGNSGSPPESP